MLEWLLCVDVVHTCPHGTGSWKSGRAPASAVGTSPLSPDSSPLSSDASVSSESSPPVAPLSSSASPGPLHAPSGRASSCAHAPTSSSAAAREIPSLDRRAIVRTPVDCCVLELLLQP